LVKNNTGYDLKHCCVGSEGTLGIVTRAVVRLVPAPISQLAACVSLTSYDHVVELLCRARRLPSLSAFEVMWRDYYQLIADSGTGRSPVTPDQPFYVLCEAMGYDEEMDALLFNQFLERAYEDGVIADAAVASSGQQVEDLWRVREGSEVIV